MLGLAEVTYTYATITCDHPECTNSISLRPGPEDLERELTDLKALGDLAIRRGWKFINDGTTTECNYHTRKDTE